MSRNPLESRFVTWAGCILARTFRLVLLRNKYFLVLLLLFAVVCGAGISRLKTAMTFESMLSADDPTQKTNRQMERDFGKASGMAVRIARNDGMALQKSDLCSASALLQDLHWVSGVKSVFSIFDVRGAQFSDSRLLYPQLVSSNCENAESIHLVEKFAGSPWLGVILDEKGKSIVAQLEFKEDADAPVSRNATQIVFEKLRLFSAKNSSLSADAFGDGAVRIHFEKTLAHDQLVNLFFLFFVVLICRMFFGRWRAGLLLAGAFVFAGILTYGAMAISGFPLDMLSNSIFLMTSIAAIEDFFYVAALHAQGHGFRTSFSRLLMPCCLTSLTTVIGFGSLCLSSVSTIRHFGFWAAYGSVMEWIVICFGMPALMACFPSLRQFCSQVRLQKKEHARSFFQTRIPPALFRVCLVAGVCALAGLFHLHTQDDLNLVFPESHPYRRTLENVARDFGWRGQLEVVANEEHADLAFARLSTLPNVVHVLDATAIANAMAAHMPPLLQQVVWRDLEETSFFSRFHAHNGKSRAVLFLRDDSLEALRPLKLAIVQKCAPVACEVGGNAMTFLAFSEKVIPTFLESVVVSLVLIGALCVVLCRLLGRREWWGIVISALWGPVMMIGIFAAAGVWINYITVVFASIVVSLSGDNAIHYLFAARGRTLSEGLDVRAKSSLQISTMILCSAVLFFFSGFLQLRMLGALLIAGVVLNIFGDVWILRGFFPRQTLPEANLDNPGSLE